MENQKEQQPTDETEPNPRAHPGSRLVSEKTEDVEISKRKLDKEQRGLGEENNGDDYLGKDNRVDEE